MTSPRDRLIISNYFEQINHKPVLVTTLSDADKLAYLNQLFLLHIQTIPFHNFSLREASHNHPVNRAPLTLFDKEQFVKGQRGGFCFQTTELLFYVLKYIGFDVHRSISKVLKGLAPDSKEAKRIPATHLVLVTKIADKSYMLDTTAMMNGHMSAFALEEKETIYQQNKLVFKIEKNHGDYILSEKMLSDKKEEEKWSTITCSSLKPANEMLISKQLRQLERFPDSLGIRDIITLVGIATPTGVKTLLWHPAHKKFILKTLNYHSPNHERKFSSMRAAYHFLCHEFKITHITEKQFIKYCTEQNWPKPKHSLEIHFPIDEHEKMQIRKSFRS